jgi:hypothetical protein
VQPLVQSDNEENCEYERDVNVTGIPSNVNSEIKDGEKEKLIN